VVTISKSFARQQGGLVRAGLLPEDALALELANLWSEKIREYHGDPVVHGQTFDEYGRADIEAWRAVARHVSVSASPGPLKGRA
jgi:hypothetical protein